MPGRTLPWLLWYVPVRRADRRNKVKHTRKLQVPCNSARTVLLNSRLNYFPTSWLTRRSFTHIVNPHRLFQILQLIKPLFRAVWAAPDCAQLLAGCITSSWLSEHGGLVTCKVLKYTNLRVRVKLKLLAGGKYAPPTHMLLQRWSSYNDIIKHFILNEGLQLFHFKCITTLCTPVSRCIQLVPLSLSHRLGPLGCISDEV